MSQSATAPKTTTKSRNRSNKETNMTTSAKIRALHKQGKKPSEIARLLGKRPQHVYNVLKAGEPKQVRTPTVVKKVPAKVAKLPTTAAKIRALWDLGWSKGEIAKALQIIYQHVNNTVIRDTKDWSHKNRDRRAKAAAKAKTMTSSDTK